jgi:hypothetical protein
MKYLIGLVILIFSLSSPAQVYHTNTVALQTKYAGSEEWIEDEYIFERNIFQIKNNYFYWDRHGKTVKYPIKRIKDIGGGVKMISILTTDKKMESIFITDTSISFPSQEDKGTITLLVFTIEEKF